MNGTDTLRPRMDRIQHAALGVGIVALFLSLLGGVSNSDQFFHSYLFAFLFWLGIALGCSAVLMLHHLVAGGWGLIIRRLLESGTRTMPLMLLLMVPLVFGLPKLYLWADPSAVIADKLLQHKHPYLNVPFFLIRAALYFALWLIFSYYLNKWSFEQDRTGDPSLLHRMRVLSGPGLVIYCLTATFAAIDWVMSLSTEWYSTAYGLEFIVGQVLTSLAFVIGAAMLFAGREPMSAVVTRDRMIDLGNLMLTFVMLWAYIAFTQFLIIWAGNLPDEISWYRIHIRSGWIWIAVILFLFHFALPFLLLLFRDVKRKAATLAAVAGAMMLMRLVDAFWLVEATAKSTFQINWMDILLPIGMGGIWIAVFVWQLKGKPLLPLHPGFGGAAKAEGA